MRRRDREITDFSKMIEIVESCDCCRLGLMDENEVYIVPLSFGYETNDEQLILYFHSANEGRKVDLLSKGATVSFEMDMKHALVEGKTGCDFSYLYQCVMGTGTVEVLSNTEEKIHGLQKILSHYTNKAQWEMNEKVLGVTTVLKLTVNKWSCKEH